MASLRETVRRNIASTYCDMQAERDYEAKEEF